MKWLLIEHFEMNTMSHLMEKFPFLYGCFPSRTLDWPK